jgi:hypothetical protein
MRKAPKYIATLRYLTKLGASESGLYPILKFQNSVKAIVGRARPSRLRSGYMLLNSLSCDWEEGQDTGSSPERSDVVEKNGPFEVLSRQTRLRTDK